MLEILKKWFNQPVNSTNTKSFSQVQQELYKVNNYSSFLPKLNKAELLTYYNKSPMLRACVSKISESISTNEWDLFRITKNGNRTQIFNHDILNLMKTFNPLFSTGIDGWFLTQVYLEVNGNAFIHKERDKSNKVRYLWLYNPLDVEELPTIS